MYEGERKDDLAEKPQEATEEYRKETTKVVYVDDLANEQDYWLSLTDAARVTRRQEVTVRRWVMAGTLPVRRTPVGLNKRTRHVRASDLAKLTPIIDPTAAITGDVGSLDLTNIPLQHAQMMALQQELAQRLAQSERTTAEFAALREADRRHQETTQQETMTVLRQDLLLRLQELRQELVAQLQQTESDLRAHDAVAHSTMQMVAQQLVAHTEASQKAHQELAVLLTVQAAELKQETLRTQQMQAQAEQDRRWWQQRLHEESTHHQEALQLQYAQVTDEFHKYMVTLHQEWQHRFSCLEAQHALLQTELQVEQQRRIQMETQVRHFKVRQRRVRQERIIQAPE